MMTSVVIAIASTVLGPAPELTYADTFTTGLTNPGRLALAPGGGIYVTDEPAGQVIEYDAAGAVLNTYSIPEGPVGIAVHPGGEVFISRSDGEVGVYDASFVYQESVDPAPFSLAAPNDIAIHPATGEVFVVDSEMHRVMVFDYVTDPPPAGWKLVGMWAYEGQVIGALDSPQAIAIDAALDRVVIADVDGFRINVYDTAGTHQFKFGYRIAYAGMDPLAWIARTGGIAIDECSNIYASDALMGVVRTFDPAGVDYDLLNPPIGFGTGAGELRVPRDIIIDDRSPISRLYVVSTNNSAVEVYTVGCIMAPLQDPAPHGKSASAQDLRLPRQAGHAQVPFADVIKKTPALPQYPDNPLVIAEAIHAGTYDRELDLNMDRRLDVQDLSMAVDRFGAGTVEGFLAMVGSRDYPPTLEAPHMHSHPETEEQYPWICGRCHSLDQAPGGMLTAEGQENLCLSCHSPGGTAMSQVIGGIADNINHPLAVPADDNGVLGPDPESELALHLDDGNIRCGTCHDQHTDLMGEPYLRAETGRGQLCGECHVQTSQWLNAGHADEEGEAFVHYDWTEPGRAACRKCHSGNGFIGFSEGLSDDDQSGEFRVHDCLVCHSTHGEDNEHLLRVVDEVELPGGTIITDAGHDASCMVCHNGRREPGGYSAAPHYLLGGVMLVGINGAEFGNTSLGNSEHTTAAGCSDCHMAPSPTAGNPGAGKVGGHSFNMTVHTPGDPDEGFENVENACGGCHTGLTAFNRTARADFDGNGTVEGVQDEVQGLMDTLLTAITDTGAIYLGHYPYWDFSAVVDDPPGFLQTVRDAVWNWEYVKNDGSLGVHNTEYAVGLLQLSYEQVTGTILPGADLRYTPDGGYTPVADYVGPDTCLTCHGPQAITGMDYTVFLRNGHGYKLNEIENGLMPTYPFSSIAGALGMIADDDLPPDDPHPGTDNTLSTPLDYSDVSYVIGGFGWKSRWIDADGFIVTGSEVQYNLETMAMASYHNDEVDKKYNCGNCHTTGWKAYTSEPGDLRNLNRQGGLPGMHGTFAQPGVQCEACHGAGSLHAMVPSTANITRLAAARSTDDFLADDMAYGKAAACGDCHTRDGEKDYPTYVGGPGRIAAKGGLIRHHEQYDEMRGIDPDDDPTYAATGPHRDLLCGACHDPHTTTKYMDISGDAPGMDTNCTVCHNTGGVGGKDYNITSGGMTGLVCIDCHMPKLVKSAVGHDPVGTGPATGDIRSHIFRIDLTSADQFTGDGSFAYPSLTGSWACKTCHNNVDQFDLGFPSAITIHGAAPAGPYPRRGGLLYDKWWKVNGAPEPTGDHPLYPPAALKSGSTTYRCKECHGWDYIGYLGRYESGSHYTGIIGVLDAATNMTELDIFDIIKNPNGDGTGGTTVNGHDFGTIGLSDDDINDLVAFIKNGGVIDTGPHINTTGTPGSYTYSFNGIPGTGATLYGGGVNPAADCTICHGSDGTAIDFGGGAFVGTLANDNPQETLHKIRLGHPGSSMTSYFDLGMTDAQGADVGAYCETLPQ